MSISNPALRYHGGKWRLAPWIISHFPVHVCYVEPFGGAASVLLRKTPSDIEVYNDLNSDVVNFFRVLREQSIELIKAIERTPYSREEFLSSQIPADDPLEKARRFYVWSWQGRGRAGVIEPGGWRFMSRNTRGTTPAEDWASNDQLWDIVNRLKLVQIENDDAITVIERYDTEDTLFYLDPPYVQSTRGQRWSQSAYKYELTDDQQVGLCRFLKNIKGMSVLSGYKNDIYDDLLDNWDRFERKAAKDNGVRKTTECLWVSPNATAKQIQKRLFHKQKEGLQP